MAKKKKWPPNEEALCSVLIDWLEEEGWDVYQEVSFHSWVADIVAVRRKIIWVIEAKTGYNMTVMEQAHRWLSYAHLVSVATPDIKKRKGHFMADSILRYYGIGRLVVPAPINFRGRNEIVVRQGIYPKYNRKRGMLKKSAQRLLDTLRPEHKTWAKAGSQHGKRVTAFGLTRDKVQKIVKENPGITLHDLINKIDHHYSSDSGARRYIALYVTTGVIGGVRIDREGRRLRFYPEG